MARSVRVPLHVIKSKISASAKILWIELALLSSQKNPQVAIDTKVLAERIGRSKATLSRLIRELEKAELLVHTGVVNRHHKTYNLVRMKSGTKIPLIPPFSNVKIEPPIILTPTLSKIPAHLHADVIRIFKANPIEADFHANLMTFLKQHWESEQNQKNLNSPGSKT
ncbi:MAG: helix-turn-helix domain-containing protein [Myxococcaceae bacterium]